jgi:hypothetical protein
VRSPSTSKYLRDWQKHSFVSANDWPPEALLNEVMIYFYYYYLFIYLFMAPLIV